MMNEERALKFQGTMRRLASNRDDLDWLRWLLDELCTLKQTYPADNTLAVWEASRRGLGLNILGLCIGAKVADIVLQQEVEVNG